MDSSIVTRADFKRHPGRDLVAGSGLRRANLSTLASRRHEPAIEACSVVRLGPVRACAIKPASHRRESSRRKRATAAHLRPETTRWVSWLRVNCSLAALDAIGTATNYFSLDCMRSAHQAPPPHVDKDPLRIQRPTARIVFHTVRCPERLARTV